jgi:hypothetical protein
MAELANPVGYKLPVITQHFEAPRVTPLVPDQRGAAKAALWGSIAKAISDLPKTLIDSYKAGQEIRIATAKEKDRVKDEQAKRDREAALQAKMQEALIPSATAVDSPRNQALGVEPEMQGGEGFGKPALSDFSVGPAGTTYKPADPKEDELKQAEINYYNQRAALSKLGKTNVGITFPSVEAATAAGYDPTGGKLHPDGSITVEQFKTREDKGKRLTEGEQKTTTYITRATAANDNLGEILKTYDPTQGKGAAETFANNKVPALANFFVSSDQQKMKQAADEFATAILRKDTGAAISKAEREEVYKTYIPQPGDQPGVLEAKQVARQRAIDALKQSLPQADQTKIAHALPPVLPGAALPAAAAPAATSTSPTTKATTSASGQVRVKSPGGKTGFIPATQLDAALQKGYTLIE